MIGFDELFRDSLDGSSVYPREVVKLALQYNAAAVILVYNHPSGDPAPKQRRPAVKPQSRNTDDGTLASVRTTLAGARGRTCCPICWATLRRTDAALHLPCRSTKAASASLDELVATFSRLGFAYSLLPADETAIRSDLRALRALMSD